MMNLGDPELELIDPTPNVHTLFIHFDKIFFWTKLASRAVVRWSKRMYSCAGVCSYDRGGLCDIALSEPLLKLRPRKDLIETLLHEMIHAYLFITCHDQDRDGHGPNFQAHMHRINKSAGLNISIYHDFHDEVKLYQTHWWRCNGPCQNRRPHFGIVRKAINKAPAPSDYWFDSHRRNCGGTFIKIKEPENTRKKTVPVKKNNNGDITKFINNPKKSNSTKPILKDSNSIPVKSNGGGTLILTKKEPVYNPKVVHKPPPLFDGTGHVINGSKQRSNSVGVVETVRNIWANKQLSGTASTISATVRNKWANKQLPPSPNIVNIRNKEPALSTSSNTAKKHKSDNVITSPPPKMKKIDDYFKSTATNMLKDLYGQDFLFTNSDNQHKVAAVAIKTDISNAPVSKVGSSDPGKDTLNSVNSVNCPVCNFKINSKDINKHLDECLNKDVIDDLCKNNEILISQSTPSPLANILPSPIKGQNVTEKSTTTYNPVEDDLNTAIVKIERHIKHEVNQFDLNDINKAKELVKKIKHEEHVIKSNKYIIPKEEKIENIGYEDLPSYLDDDVSKIKKQIIKTEPGTSDSVEFVGQICACCGNNIMKPIEEHLEECLAFFTNNTTEPDEGASTSYANETIIIDDDEFDESLTLNATGTKSPCPCCLQMIEQEEMNKHLDLCLT